MSLIREALQEVDPPQEDAPPVQSDQSDEDRREKSESRAGIRPFESGEERRLGDRDSVNENWVKV